MIVAPHQKSGNVDLIYPDEVFAIQGAVFEVYKVIGAGFLEGVYQGALELELASRGIPFVAQKPIDVFYKGTRLVQNYRADIVCYDKIIIEVKAVKQLLPEHHAQIMNYLKASKMRLGLLINFCGYPGVDIKRVAN